jgi:putative addiction module component (TIGR02574 family)
VSQTPRQLLDEALDLPSEDRGRIAARLIESLDSDSDADTSWEAWSEELERRLASIDDGGVQMIPWSEVQRRLRDDNGAATD